MNFSSDSLVPQMLRNFFLMETESICLLKGDLNSLESLNTCIQWTSAANSCSAIGTGGLTKWETWRELKIYESTSSLYRNWEKVMIRFKGSLSQIPELQERVNCMNDSGEFQDIESNYSGKISHVRSQPAIVLSPRSMPSCDKRLPIDTWNLSGSQGNRFCQSTFYVRFITDILSRNSSLYDTKCHRCDSSACLHRATCRTRWRTNWEHDNNADVWKKAVNHEFFFTRGNSTEFCGWTAKTADIGTSLW